ncbi:MAG: T9SS type A sorting domain-containing protein [Bacteroidetes bacterium]|nr:T9SS type A sorting domain-containing protein [Bacteroidota bacterium]
MHHADANGDGWIDQDDTTVVISNYGQSHPLANPDPQRPAAGPDLAVVPVGSVFAAGDTVHLKVMAGNNVLPVDLLSAIGFKVGVPPGLIVPGSYEVTTVNNWLCPDSNCIMYHRADETNGIAAVSLARLDGDQVSAYGELADISFVVNAAYTGSPTVTISLNDYRAFDPEVTPISLSPIDGIIQVTNTSAEEIAAFDGLKLYPNPTGGEVNLLFNYRGQPNEGVQIEVLDIAGRVVKSFNAVQLRNGVQQIQLDCSDLINGMYFISIQSMNEWVTLKLVKN